MLTAEKAILNEYWGKCPFCGATNGMFDTVLQQHKTRCRWLGDANVFDAMHPNYAKLIAEDDVRYLSMMWAQQDLVLAKKELEKLRKIAEAKAE